MENNEYGTGRKDWMEIFEPSGGDGTLRSNNSVFTPPANCKVKGRNFKGSCTDKGHGPVNAPKVTSGGGFTDYGPNDPVSTGPSSDGGAMGDGGGGGGGMGESINSKFITFLESMETESTTGLIGVVKSAYIAINEANDTVGKLNSLLHISTDKNISDVYTSPDKLARDVVRALKGDTSKAISALKSAVSNDASSRVIEKALKSIQSKTKTNSNSNIDTEEVINTSDTFSDMKPEGKLEKLKRVAGSDNNKSGLGIVGDVAGVVSSMRNIGRKIKR